MNNFLPKVGKWLVIIGLFASAGVLITLGTPKSAGAEYIGAGFMVLLGIYWMVHWAAPKRHH